MQLQKIANNTYEFTLTNDISTVDLENKVLSFREFKDRGEKINLLGLYHAFPSLDSMLSVSELIKLKLKSFGVINKYAILADRAWVKNLVHLTYVLTPSFSVKTFSVDQRQAAVNWLTKDIANTYNPEEYLTDVNIKKLNPSTFMISLDNNTIDHAAMSALNNILSDLHKGEHINLIVVLDNMPSFESFKAFIEGLKVDFKILSRLDKYAIVSDIKWLEAYSKVGNFLTPGIDVKTFSISEIDEAKKWASDKKQIHELA